METSKTIILGIGLPRTGTLSLSFALEMLGFNCIHHHYRWPDIFMFEKNAAAIIQVDIPTLQLLPQAMPTVKFICTVRKEEEWLESMRKIYEYPLGNNNPLLPLYSLMRLSYFGTITPTNNDLLLFKQKYMMIIKDKYESLDRFMYFDITTEENDFLKWTKLINFIGLQVEENIYFKPFPYKNQSSGKINHV